MSATKAAAPEQGALIVQYDVTDAAIATLAERFKGISFDTPANYDVGRRALGELRDIRGKIERRRKELKADSLEFGRKVDAAAKHLTALVEAIEDPLAAAKKAIDDEEARKKQEAEKAELRKLDEELRLKREKEEADAKAAREAEEKRLAEERARLDEEKRQHEAKQREEEERQRAERQRIETEQRRLDAQRREIEEREAAARREQEARDVAARAEEEAKQKAAAEMAEVARLQAMKPDLQKVHDFASQLAELAETGGPDVDAPECEKALQWACGRLRTIADGLWQFKGKL